MPRLDLQDKPIIITGASSGIGRATALRCAAAGMPVVACARRVDRLESLCSEIESAGGRALAAPLDVDSPEACRAVVARCVERFGGVYSVFANAGYGFERQAHLAGDAELRAIFETNFWGSMHIITPAIPHMIAAHAGHVLFCSSCLALLPLPRYAPYCATKAAQHHFGRAMRIELRPHGVHVSTVHPIGTSTEFFETANARSGGARLFDASKERFMQPADRVARAVVAALRRPRPEIWTSATMRIALTLARLSPRATDVLLDRMHRRRLRSSSSDGDDHR